MKSLQWFINKSRSKNKVYRDDSGCSCGTCSDIVDNGFIIRDKNHADYCYEMQCVYWQENKVDLHYRSEKKLRIKK